MKKRTPEDAAFAARFGRELKAKYDQAKEKKITDAVFAESIGVMRAQLDKYLRGEAVPGIRTVALARRKYGIAVPYDGVDVSRVRNGARQASAPEQLELPFVIWAEGQGHFDLKLRPVSARKFALDLVVRKVRA
jgi:transcriptional regulator with XRE-family HTH domain